MTTKTLSQFMRIESYSRAPSKLQRRNGHRAAAEVLDVIKREPHACPHVENPQRPVVLRGSLDGTLAKALALAEGACDSLGRALRKDTHILAGCVVSYPVPVAEVEANAEEQQRLSTWIDKCVRWADAEFSKDNIDTIVFQRDQSMPHLHIIVMPPAPGVEASPLRRAAKTAAAAAKNTKHVRKSERQAFQAEGRRIQDSLYNEVSIHFGHLRRGQASRRRLSPRERKIELHNAQALQEAKNRAEQVLLQEAQVRLQQSLIEDQQAALKELANRLALRELALNERERLLSARDAQRPNGLSAG